MNTIDQLVYISRSLLEAETASTELNAIVEQSSHHNRQHAITGVLALIDGYFVQLLEGAPAALDLLMLHLHFDTRHTDIDVVARQIVKGRSIPAWNMVISQNQSEGSQGLQQLVQSRSVDLSLWRSHLLEGLPG